MNCGPGYQIQLHLQNCFCYTFFKPQHRRRDTVRCGGCFCVVIPDRLIDVPQIKIKKAVWGAEQQMLAEEIAESRKEVAYPSVPRCNIISSKAQIFQAANLSRS